MKLYNSLTKQIEYFVPLESGEVSIYSCGPTVYNNLHIGNLSAFIYADLLRRTLASEYDVKAVMNITDVDDKTIRDSKRDYPELGSMEALKKLTSKYEQVFIDDIAKVGNDIQSITFIRATETIDEMITLTQKLLDAGIAYSADDGIYFSIEQYELAGHKYGKLQQIDHKNEQARINSDEYDKDSASDFALWKRQEAGEPAWPAKFKAKGKAIDMPGRPGWHIECSAMSEKLLGTPFDIHTGGIDLKFPHHENEIAQSCGASAQTDFAKYFVHNNHVLIDGKKMSKSLGNFYTLRDIEANGYDPMAFRLLVLSSHYRSESNFSWEILEAAQNRLNSWQATADLRWQTIQADQPKAQAAFDKTAAGILEALENDLDTPTVLAIIDKLFDSVSKFNLNEQSRRSFENILETINNLLGIDLFRDDISDEQKELISQREKARENKDWLKSDEIRESLKEQSIELNDTQNGTIWSHTDTKIYDRP